MSTELIRNLQNAALYPHPVRGFKVIETHISWVILTGDYSYKIKKPVDFKFLDFSTLDKRKYFCAQELNLNQALAPEIYQEVVAITGSDAQPVIQGDTPPIEYALKMKEFSQEMLFDKLLARNELTPELIDELAVIIAKFHSEAEAIAADAFIGTPEQVMQPVEQNFEQIRPFLTDATDISQLDKLQHWAKSQFAKLHEVFQQRKDNGFIRACHGDIHLGNIVLYQNKPVIFDCIEFNESFRWTDTMADLGFIAMDLEDNQRPDYAHRLVNIYLQQTGDYAGLKILPFYIAYRAMVRAKISLFRLAQPGISADEQEAVKQKYRSCTALAERYTALNHPSLIITHGVSGSGKSTLAKMLVEQTGAIQIRADIERKRLFGLAAHEASNSPLNSHIYSADATERTLTQMEKLTHLILSAGYSVIVDATFLKKKHRETLFQLAKQLQIPFAILHTYAPKADLVTWIHKRINEKRDPSEASLEVLEMQLEEIEPLTTDEKCYAISIDTSVLSDIAPVLGQMKRLLAEPV